MFIHDKKEGGDGGKEVKKREEGQRSRKEILIWTNPQSRTF
jgi:hypothetical protein